MSQSPAAVEAEAVTSAPLAKFSAGSRFASLDPSVANMPSRPRMLPYIMWFNQRTGTQMQTDITEQLGGIALGTPVLVDNGTYRRLDVGCSTLLLGEFRFFGKYDFDAEGAPLTAAVAEEPEGNNQNEGGYKEALHILCLHCFADPSVKPVVSVSRMLTAQCAWVKQIIAGILRAAEPDWLAEQAKRDPGLGAAFASIDPRFRVVASLSGQQKKKYAMTSARVRPHTRETWQHLGRALVDDPNNPDNVLADIDAGRAALDERIAEVEEEIEATQHRASASVRKKR